MSSSRLRIAVWHNLPIGGARRSLVAHVRGLTRLGHEVEIWSPPVGPTAAFMPFDEGIVQHEVPLDPAPPEGSNYLSRIANYAREHQRSVAAMTAHSIATGAEINAGKFDVLFATNCRQFHAPFIGRYVVGPKLLYLQDPKRILYEAGERLIWRKPTPAPAGTKPWLRMRTRFHDAVTIRDSRKLAELDYWNVAAFDEMLVNSYFSRESMLRAYNIESKVCYLGIDCSLFRASEEPKGAYVMGLGSITTNKNIEFLIRSIGTVPAAVRPKLVWVGQADGEAYSGGLRALAQSLGVDLGLRTGVGDAELVRLLGEATAFVYAPRLEPFGFAPLEANACGTPAIAVAEGGVRETIVDGLNGFVVGGDPAAFGEKVGWLMSKPEVAQTMGRQAAEHVRSNWTWDRSVEILDGELRGLVAR